MELYCYIASNIELNIEIKVDCGVNVSKYRLQHFVIFKKFTSKQLGNCGIAYVNAKNSLT